LELPLEESLKQVFDECISFIQKQVNIRDEPHQAIHESRRTIKRIRALLRMIRDEIGYSTYYRENNFYRDLSRRLSPVRDSYVLQQTLQALSLGYPEYIPEKQQGILLRALGSRTETELQRFIQSYGGFDHFIEELMEAQKRAETYSHVRDEFDTLRKGIRRNYRRGARYLEIVVADYREAPFHEYRKCTKYLLYQMELLSPIYPKLLKAYIRSIDKHAELLGLTRDYERLEKYLLERKGTGLGITSRGKMAEKIRLLRVALIKRSFRTAHTIYAERPDDFIERLETYWNLKRHTIHNT
jgi:CHAD domain-containing protein